jgi:predicted aspartyl protease
LLTILLASLLFAPGDARAAQNPAHRMTKVPFEDGVDVLVNGKGPFRFGIDTGASGSAWVSPELAARLGLPAAGRISAHDGDAGSGTSVNIVHIDVLTIGTFAYHNLAAPVAAQHSDGRRGDSAPPLMGTLGFELFSKQLVTLDYPGHELIIQDGSLPKPDGKTVLRYTLDHTTAVIPIRLGSLETTAHVDTGGGGEIMVPLSIVKTLPLDSPLKEQGQIATSFRKARFYTATLNGDLAIGSFAFSHPRLACSEILPYLNIGRDLLHRFALTFDQRHQRLRLALDQVRPGSQAVGLSEPRPGLRNQPQPWGIKL